MPRLYVRVHWHAVHCHSIMDCFVDGYPGRKQNENTHIRSHDKSFAISMRFPQGNGIESTEITYE